MNYKYLKQHDSFASYQNDPVIWDYEMVFVKIRPCKLGRLLEYVGASKPPTGFGEVKYHLKKLKKK